MLNVIMIMTAGILVGVLIRKRQRILKPLDLSINLVIYFLLFFLGVAVGTNEAIVANMGTYGVKALLLTVGGVAGSVAVAFFTYKMFFKKDDHN